MSKKKVKKTKKAAVKRVDPKISRLNKDLEFTLKAIDGKSEVLDKIFADQANRIKEEIIKHSENNDLS